MNTNQDVIDAWLEQRACFSKNVSTDGVKLFSYKLRIGYCDRSEHPSWLILDRNTHSVSQTTSRHIGLAVRAVSEKGLEFHLHSF